MRGMPEHTTVPSPDGIDAVSGLGHRPRAPSVVLGALAAFFALAVGSAEAQTWVGGSAHHTRVLVNGGGEAWVGVWLDAPNAGGAARAPMAVSLVMDTSGSMAGDKIQNARVAAASLLETLADGDIVSVYAFSSGVSEVAPPTVLSHATRAVLLQRVGAMSAAGGTNLWDGLQAGIARMSQAPATHPLRRIFLVSDGHANIGPSDPASLANLAATATEWGTQISAIGVGLDYDQRTLASMTVQSSGRLYHLRESHQMAGILEQELSLLARSVALDAVLEVAPAPGVTIVGGATTGAVMEGGRLRLPLGAVHAGQRREVLFRARLPAGDAGGRPLATARLVYRTPDGSAAREQAVELRYEVTRDRAAAARSVEPRVAAMVADREAVEAQRRAAQLMEQGRREQAAAELEAARRRLDQAAAAAPRAPSSEHLRSRARALSEAGAAARSAQTEAEMRARSYDFADDAMSAEGY